MSTFSILPIELQIQILSFVHPWDYPAVLQVCSLWRSIISSRDIQKLRHPIFHGGDTEFRIHWLLYSRFYCSSHCPVCINKYESHKAQYPSLSAATAKRIFLTAKLHPLNTELTSYELWIENCTFSPASAEARSGNFRKIDIPHLHPLLNETVVSYEQLPQHDLSPEYYSSIRARLDTPFFRRHSSRLRWILRERESGDATAASLNQYTAALPISEGVYMAELGELLSIPKGMLKFHLQYDACFPHCIKRIFDKEAPTANLTIPIHPGLTVRQLVDVLWERLRKICYKNPARDIERALQVRFCIIGASEDGLPILKLSLDVEGICCQEIENLTLCGGVWESVFSRFNARDAGVILWNH
ncbi:hypothetical protein EYR41_008949 [Orbilia oligospora]|uniref:Uncharacterized protein n=1 Tax=Orbilia oligospora TaxID=2813651 RepID=A0A7C8PPA3_ORBOL|nr:hypothetical protein TWF751_003984 [Orbilia oligospora]TGJ64943.1 hypothetical protein EYR41_008949 [Orbilia oligospora]